MVTFTITHHIDGVEVYKKSFTRGSEESLMEASQTFHHLVHEATEEHPFSREDEDEGFLLEPVVSDGLIDHYENNGKPLNIEDDSGKIHSFQMIRS